MRRLVRMGNEGPCARLQSRGCGGGEGMWQSKRLCLHLLFNSFNYYICDYNVGFKVSSELSTEGLSQQGMAFNPKRKKEDPQSFQ